jgi:hypothetical protein
MGRIIAHGIVRRARRIVLQSVIQKREATIAMGVGRACSVILLAAYLITGLRHTNAQTVSPTTDTTERLKVVLSKIAPLEKWDSSSSANGPLVCWELFRPDPDLFVALSAVIRNFQGHSKWIWNYKNCLEPVGDGAFVAPPMKNLPSAPALAPFTMSAEDASSDLRGLADAIENQLRLHDKKPVAFDPAMLTREGLRESRAPFQDFSEGGELTVFLIVNPTSVETREPAKSDKFLHFAPMDYEFTAIFNDILHTDLTLDHGRAMTESEVELIKKDYPTFWKIADYYQDSYVSPEEAQVLLHECAALDNKATSPAAMRGLDKLMRIAKWAVTKHYGVLFSAP